MSLESPPAPNRTRWAFALVALLVSAAWATTSACIIGPKQDDPADETTRDTPDAAAASDTSAGGFTEDTAAPSPADSGTTSDARTDAAADAPQLEGGCGDAAADDAKDACTSGGADAVAGD